MKKVTSGLRANLSQFVLLIVLNGFVGGMIGMERSVLPNLASEEFGLSVKTAIFSFIVAFGVSKALANLLTGALASRFGRKRLLMLGWLFGIPVPFILIYAPEWSYIVFANVLLGIHQGFAWSATVIMKIDLVGEKNRGLAMGLNEFAGYMAVGLLALATGWIAGEYGLRPYPFMLGIALSVSGFLLSWLFVRDTRGHVVVQALDSKQKRLKSIFWDTSWRDRNLSAVTLSGLVNNLNDGMVWGLLPLLLAEKGFGLREIGTLAAVYPLVWGISQLLTGWLSDFICKKNLLFWGMILQGAALIVLVWAASFYAFFALLAILGFGTALVYPTFLASIAENTHPHDRAHSLGIFRFWRDSGYAFGALLTGVLADFFDISAVLLFVGLLTGLTGFWADYRMKCKVLRPIKLVWPSLHPANNQ